MLGWKRTSILKIIFFRIFCKCFTRRGRVLFANELLISVDSSPSFYSSACCVGSQLQSKLRSLQIVLVWRMWLNWRVRHLSKFPHAHLNFSSRNGTMAASFLEKISDLASTSHTKTSHTMIFTLSILEIIFVTWRYIVGITNVRVCILHRMLLTCL